MFTGVYNWNSIELISTVPTHQVILFVYPPVLIAVVILSERWEEWMNEWMNEEEEKGRDFFFFRELLHFNMTPFRAETINLQRC